MVNRNKKKGTAFETFCRRAFPDESATRMAGRGQPDLFIRGKDGEMLLTLECERSRRIRLKHCQRTKLAQAERLRRTGTLAALVAQYVGPPGQPQEPPYVLMELNDFVSLLAGLGAFE